MPRLPEFCRVFAAKWAFQVTVRAGQVRAFRLATDCVSLLLHGIATYTAVLCQRVASETCPGYFSMVGRSCVVSSISHVLVEVAGKGGGIVSGYPTCVEVVLIPSGLCRRGKGSGVGR